MSIHRFTPDTYYDTLGPHEPVLRIKSGDTVETTTLDARGYDKDLNQPAPTVNPMTGPFYVEDAEPGDTLAVTFDYIYPNRKRGWTLNLLDHQVLDAPSFKRFPEREVIYWEQDLEAGTVQLEQPLPKLGDFKLNMESFFGCFGTAPDRNEAISTSSSAEHGGNMDYRMFTQGSTAYFPVFREGALFFLGDGHSIQGDGEIVGTGVETSMDVKFTVKLLKGKRIEWPRGENDEYIFTIGNAKPLEWALKHATSEMLRWLRTDYGLNDVEASTLLGQCVEYDVGNIYNPAYTIACRLKKSILAAHINK